MCVYVCVCLCVERGFMKKEVERKGVFAQRRKRWREYAYHFFPMHACMHTYPYTYVHTHTHIPSPSSSSYMHIYIIIITYILYVFVYVSVCQTSSKGM